MTLLFLNVISCQKQESEVIYTPPEITANKAGIQPVDLAFDGENIWISNYGDDTVM